MRRPRYSIAVITVVIGLVACAATATKSMPKDGVRIGSFVAAVLLTILGDMSAY